MLNDEKSKEAANKLSQQNTKFDYEKIQQAWAKIAVRDTFYHEYVMGLKESRMFDMQDCMELQNNAVNRYAVGLNTRDSWRKMNSQRPGWYYQATFQN